MGEALLRMTTNWVLQAAYAKKKRIVLYRSRSGIQKSLKLYS